MTLVAPTSEIAKKWFGSLLAKEVGTVLGNEARKLMEDSESSSNSVSIFYPSKYNNGGKVKYGQYAVTLKDPYFSFKLEASGGGSKAITNQEKGAVTGVVTNISLAKAEIVSVTPTIGKDIYLYVGGETSWELYLTGIALQPCGISSQGFMDVLNWYTKENVAKTGKSCKLTLLGGEKNGATFRAYLQAFRIQSIKDINAFQFTFKFYAVKI